MATRTPVHLAPPMKDRGSAAILVLAAAVAIVIVTTVWFSLETASRLIGALPTALLALVPLAASLWGLWRILRK